MTDLGSAMANAAALERAVEVLKKDIWRSSVQKARTMKMASNYRYTGIKVKTGEWCSRKVKSKIPIH